MRTGDHGSNHDGNHDDHHLLNPFVRFKHHVDSTFASAFTTMFNPSEGSSSSSGEGRPLAQAGGGLRSLMFTSYSPLALRQLPQPVPNDLPEGLDGSIFTFEDAFEDLLAMSMGQPLPDINQRYEQRKLLRHMFPSGEPKWFWIRRLKASGFLDSKPREGIDAMDQSRWDHLHNELQRRSDEVWGRSDEAENDPRYPDPWKAKMSATEAIETLGKLTGELAEEFGKLEKFLEKTGLEPWRRSGPDHFDDLFLSSLQDFADSGKRSWDAFMKGFSEHAGAQEKQRSADASSGTKVEESRDEHVDKHGYVHSKVTRRELDRDGNELSRTTSYQMYPSPDRYAETNQGSMEGADHHKEDRHEDGKKSGWFWK
ncbi:hypothetical protein ACO1O0_007995 [Amphichorda felina]